MGFGTGVRAVALGAMLAAVPGCLVVSVRDAGGPLVLQHARQRLAVRALLGDQVRAWNRGDLEGFLDGYLRSDTLRFVGSKGVRRGFPAILESYRQAYGEGAALGTLSFDIEEIRILGRDAAFVFGAYHLTHDTRPSDGYFTLLLRKTRDGWRIVHDHSSAVEAAPGAEATPGAAVPSPAGASRDAVEPVPGEGA